MQVGVSLGLSEVDKNITAFSVQVGVTGSHYAGRSITWSQCADRSITGSLLVCR